MGGAEPPRGRNTRPPRGPALSGQTRLLHAIRDHRRQVATHWLLAACCLLATTSWTYTATVHTLCREVAAAVILLEVLFILATAYSLYAAVKTHLWEEPRLLDRYIPQMTLIVIAMMLVIPFATFGQLGDGLVITQAAPRPSTMPPGWRQYKQ